MIQVIESKSGYLIQPNPNVEKLVSNQLWLAVRSLPSQRYPLKEGDTFRIGTLRVKVKEIILEDNQPEKPIEVNSKYAIYENLTKQLSKGFNPDPSSDQPICRVCLEEAEIGQNPLIAPCKCSGSAKYIHIKCIQEWFSKIMNPRKVGACIQLEWKPLVCELCNQSLPFKMYLDDCKYFTVNIPRPQKPYLVLNPISKDKSKKHYYLLSLKEKP